MVSEWFSPLTKIALTLGAIVFPFRERLHFDCLIVCGSDRAMHSQQFRKHAAEVLQLKRVRSVGFGAWWVVVDFHEYAIDSCGDGGAREYGDELGLASGGLGACGRKLDGVCGVEDYRREVAHDGE
jgi:hypothetical protein